MTVNQTTVGICISIAILSCEPVNYNNQKSVTYLLPHFKVRLTDSITRVCSWDGRELWPSLFFYFDPDCEHCRQTIEELLKQIKKFKEVNIYLMGLSGYQKLKQFEEHYQLKKYQNLVVARDVELTYVYKYQGNQVPLIVLYNSERQLVSLFRDSIGIDSIAMSVDLLNREYRKPEKE